jgi:hypothetical protein
MKFNREELEELLTIAEQCKILVNKLSYNNELIETLFDCIKNDKKLNRDNIQRCHNNYLLLNMIGFNQCNSDVFKKLDNYMDNEY